MVCVACYVCCETYRKTTPHSKSQHPLSVCLSLPLFLSLSVCVCASLTLSEIASTHDDAEPRSGRGQGFSALLFGASVVAGDLELHVLEQLLGQLAVVSLAGRQRDLGGCLGGVEPAVHSFWVKALREALLEPLSPGDGERAAQITLISGSVINTDIYGDDDVCVRTQRGRLLLLLLLLRLLLKLGANESVFQLNSGSNDIDALPLKQLAAVSDRRGVGDEGPTSHRQRGPLMLLLELLLKLWASESVFLLDSGSNGIGELTLKQLAAAGDGRGVADDGERRRLLLLVVVVVVVVFLGKSCGFGFGVGLNRKEKRRGKRGENRDS